MTSVFNISISGLNNDAFRVANATSNIVNASSLSHLPQNANNYSGFVPQDVVSIADPIGGVSDATTPYNPSYVTTYDPNSQLANGQGLVASPNVDLNKELVNANVASVNYSANAAVIKIEEKTQKALIDIVT